MCGVSVWNVRAEEFKFSGWHFVDSLPKRSEWAVLRAQFAISPKHQPCLMMAWDWADSLNYCAAKASFTEKNGDEIYGPRAEVRILKVVNGSETQLASTSVVADDNKFSFRLVYDGFSARLYAGSNQGTLSGIASFGGGGAMMIWANSEAKCYEASMIAMPTDTFSMSAFCSVDELTDYLRNSADRVEGIWDYLDRDINMANASFGGAYRLATAKNEQGGYDLIYLGGAEVNSVLWSPLQIKGRMSPTIFVDNFDLDWQDADGKVLNEDNNAQLSPDGSILTLRFPLYRSQLRFSRVRLKR